jgi:predicted nucleic-acid-binding protein
VRAIDTNVVIRFLTDDDKSQAKAARAAIEAGDIFIATTVLLESEWVLRRGYGLARDAIVAAVRDLASLAGVTVEEPARLALALEWTSEGMDFADALHLAKTEGCDAFLSFDRKLVKTTGKGSPVPVLAP